MRFKSLALNIQSLLFLLIINNAFGSELWPNVPFTEVRAYAWPNDDKTRSVILENKKLLPGAINKEGAVLNTSQIKRLIGAVTGDHPPHSTFLCYRPHNAFIFYDSYKKPVAHIEICFSCLNHGAEPTGTSKHFHMMELATLFDELKLPMGEYSNLAAFKKEHYSLLNPEALAQNAKALAKFEEQRQSKTKLLIGTWKNKDGSITIDFLKNGVYTISSSFMTSDGEFSDLPDHLKILGLLRERGFWEAVGVNRLNMTWSAYPNRGASSSYDILELDHEALEIKLSKGTPVKFQRVQ